jgi:hypothetical protein
VSNAACTTVPQSVLESAEQLTSWTHLLRPCCCNTVSALLCPGLHPDPADMPCSRVLAWSCAAMQILREDVETALAESTLAKERAALMTMESQELQRQRDQLAGQHDGRHSSLMSCSCCRHWYCCNTPEGLLMRMVSNTSSYTAATWVCLGVYHSLGLLAGFMSVALPVAVMVLTRSWGPGCVQWRNVHGPDICTHRGASAPAAWVP